jgi:hypothetical protein
MSTGDAFSELDLAPDVFVVAELTNDPNRKGIFAVEEGGELFGDGSPGSPATAAGRRVNFFLQDQGGNFLTADAEALLIAAINWLADLEDVPAGPAFVRGGCNDDGMVDVSDALCALSGLFLGQAIRCRAALDVNGDGAVDVSDPIVLLSHLFLGGVQPAPPYPACGPGERPTDEALGCAEPPASCQ